MRSPPQNPKLALAHPAPEKLAAKALELGIRLLGPGDQACEGLVLRAEAGQLQLEWAAPGGPGPLRLDFAEAGLRRRIAAGREQALARAIGIGQGRRMILDASAGLGRDAFLLASLGCRVQAVERDPILALLLAEALERAAQDDSCQEAARRINLLQVDAEEFLTRILRGEAERPEVIYLDPMYPERGKSAKAKKELEYLRYLLGKGGEEGGALLEKARQVASHRVVVKRVHRAPPLADPDQIPVLATVSSRLLRFDLYGPS